MGRFLPLSTTWCVVLALALGGCLSASARDYVEAQALVSERPPEPLETAPSTEAPDPAMAWIPGYWYWTGDDFSWVPGRWERPPMAGHVWVRAGWLESGGRYRFAPGYWAPPDRVRERKFVHRWPSRHMGPREQHLRPLP